MFASYWSYVALPMVFWWDLLVAILWLVEIFSAELCVNLFFTWNFVKHDYLKSLNNVDWWLIILINNLMAPSRSVLMVYKWSLKISSSMEQINRIFYGTQLSNCIDCIDPTNDVYYRRNYLFVWPMEDKQIVWESFL